MSEWLGIDIGGTEVKYALISDEYQLLQEGHILTDFSDANDLVNTIRDLQDTQFPHISGIGISVPGTVFPNDNDGTVYGGGALHYLDHFALGSAVATACRTATQEFIRAENLDHYNQKHRLLRDTNEADLLNSFELTCCRLCGSTNIKKDGFDRNGVRVYYCNECRHKFSVTTGTIFQDHKIPVTEWIEYERNLFQHESLTADSWSQNPISAPSGSVIPPAGSIF